MNYYRHMLRLSSKGLLSLTVKFSRKTFAFILVLSFAVSGFGPIGMAAIGAGHFDQHDMTLDENGSGQACEEHGADHAALQGNHCCASTAMGIATLTPDLFSHPLVTEVVAWPVNQRLGAGPIFGIFRPPRIE